jgi:ABC-type Fe3+/spermidine/putrescine transport system ATPase subunit
VAIARALAIEPKMLLLDEPLSALDKKLREEMQVELRQIQKKVGITTLFVTHDQEEALALADTIVVMADGAIRQIGSPSEIYLRPADTFVANFIGQSNIFQAEILEKKQGELVVRIDSGETVRLKSGETAPKGQRVIFSIRPERFQIIRRGEATPGANTFAGKVSHAIFLGSNWQIRVGTAGTRNLKVHSSEGWQEGDDVVLSWLPEAAVILPG